MAKQVGILQYTSLGSWLSSLRSLIRFPIMTYVTCDSIILAPFLSVDRFAEDLKSLLMKPGTDCRVLYTATDAEEPAACHCDLILPQICSPQKII